MQQSSDHSNGLIPPSGWTSGVQGSLALIYIYRINMNAEEASLLWNRKDDVEQAGGHAAHRQLALKHLKLKTVIKVTCGTVNPSSDFVYVFNAGRA